MTTAPKMRLHRLGIYLVAAFAALVLLVSVSAAYEEQQGGWFSGIGWMGLVFLAFPWWGIAIRAQSLLGRVAPGLVLNAVILFLLGTGMEEFWRRFIRKR